MVHLEEEAAVAEPEVVETEPENSEVEAGEGASETDPSAYYPDDVAEGEPEEGEPEGEDDDAEEGEPEEDIAVPVGLKAEQKERFAQLPVEAQRIAAELIGQRERDTQAGVEKALSAQREAERTAADTIAQTQQEYAGIFERFAEVFAPQPPDRSHYTNANDYLLAKEDYRDAMADFDKLKEQITGIKSEAGSHFQQQTQEWQQEQIKQLMSVPEYANQDTRVEFLTGVQEFALGEGFTEEELANASAREIIHLKRAKADRADAEKWRAHIAKRNQRPRQAGKFAKAAPAGGQAPKPKQSSNPLAALYPDDV